MSHHRDDARRSYERTPLYNPDSEEILDDNPPDNNPPDHVALIDEALARPTSFASGEMSRDDDETDHSDERDPSYDPDLEKAIELSLKSHRKHMARLRNEATEALNRDIEQAIENSLQDEPRAAIAMTDRQESGPGHSGHEEDAAPRYPRRSRIPRGPVVQPRILDLYQEDSRSASSAASRFSHSRLPNFEGMPRHRAPNELVTRSGRSRHDVDAELEEVSSRSWSRAREQRELPERTNNRNASQQVDDRRDMGQDAHPGPDRTSRPDDRKRSAVLTDQDDRRSKRSRATRGRNTTPATPPTASVPTTRTTRTQPDHLPFDMIDCLVCNRTFDVDSFPIAHFRDCHGLVHRSCLPSNGMCSEHHWINQGFDLIYRIDCFVCGDYRPVEQYKRLRCNTCLVCETCLNVYEGQKAAIEEGAELGLKCPCIKRGEDGIAVVRSGTLRAHHRID